MPSPFNLSKAFSVTSLISFVVLVLIMSWMLGERLEAELLERDQLLTRSIIQTEVLEYLGDAPFEAIYEDPKRLNSAVHSAMAFPGSFALDIIHVSGQIMWSSFEKKEAYFRNTPEFRRALEGKTSLRSEKEDRIAFPHEDERYASGLYIPVVREGEVIGVFELHRNNTSLQKQAHSLKKSVYLFSGLMGMILYGVMMLIVVPASRILYRQHEELRETTERLQESNKNLSATQEKLIQQERFSAIGEVSAAVAHGLKNPLASLRAAVQLMEVCSLSEEEQKELVSDILEETDHLTSRLNHLLSFVRPFEAVLAPVPLHELLEGSAKSLYWQADKAGVQIRVLPSSELLPVEADPILLEEAVLIILGNALEASSSGDSIVCSVGNKTPSSQYICITDQGDGIPEENQKRIFEQFFTTRKKGIGLGLALCKKIMDLHHGEIGVQSVLMKGSTFELLLPSSQKDKAESVEL